MGIFFAIFNTLVTAASNISIKKAYKNFDPFAAFVIMSIFCLLTWPIGAYIFTVNSDYVLTGFFYGAISALFAQGSYMYVLSKGEISITGTLIATYPIFTIVSSLLINNETLSPLGFVAISIVVIGTIIVALPEKTATERTKLSLILLPIGSAFLIGMSDTLSKHFIDEAGVGTFLLTASIIQVPISLICMVVAKERFSQLVDVVKQPLQFRFALLGTLGLALATLFLFLAFGYSQASIVAPIMGTYPAFTVMLAYIFLKEKLTRKNLIGIILVILGILAASFLGAA
jgi:transporter family protein